MKSSVIFSGIVLTLLTIACIILAIYFPESQLELAVIALVFGVITWAYWHFAIEDREREIKELQDAINL